MISVKKLASMSDMLNSSVVIFELEDSPEEQLMSSEGYVASAIILFFIGFFGFFLNLLVIILMIKEKRVSYTFFNLVFEIIVHKVLLFSRKRELIDFDESSKLETRFFFLPI